MQQHFFEYFQSWRHTSFLEDVCLCNFYQSDRLFHLRSSHQWFSIIKGVLRNCAKFTGKHLCLRPATLLKKRPCVLLWILRNFQKHLFYRTPPDDCFFHSYQKIIGDKHKKLWLCISLFGLYLFRYFLIFFMPRRFLSGLWF